MYFIVLKGWFIISIQKSCILTLILLSSVTSFNPNPVTWSLFCLGNFILPFLAWNNHQKNPGKFDFYFFDVNNIFLQKYFFQKKIFLGWKKGFRPFFASKKHFFDRKVVFISIYIKRCVGPFIHSSVTSMYKDWA